MEAGVYFSASLIVIGLAVSISFFTVNAGAQPACGASNPCAYHPATPPTVATNNSVTLQADVNGNLLTNSILSGTTLNTASPPGQANGAVEPTGIFNPAQSCHNFQFGTSTNLFNLWGTGPPGLYIEVIDPASSSLIPPISPPTNLNAEPPGHSHFGLIGGGQIGALGEWSYSSGQLHPEVGDNGTNGVTVCLSATPPPLYTAYTSYTGSAGVIMNAEIE